MEESIGLIPAAGRGLRLGLPYPKELFPVMVNGHYQPVSRFVLENLTSAGVRHVVFVINSTKHQLIDFFGDGHRFNCHLSYAVQEPRQHADRSTSPGLAEALDSAYHLIRGKRVFFGMADTIMRPAEIFANAAASHTSDCDAILILFKAARPQECGMVKLDDHGRVLQIFDKPRQTTLEMMWGAMIWRPHFTEHLHDCVQRKVTSDFAEVVNSAINNGLRICGIHLPGTVYVDVGTAEAVRELGRIFG